MTGIYCVAEKKFTPDKAGTRQLHRAKGHTRVSAICASCGKKKSGFVKNSTKQTGEGMFFKGETLPAYNRGSRIRPVKPTQQHGEGFADTAFQLAKAGAKRYGPELAKSAAKFAAKKGAEKGGEWIMGKITGKKKKKSCPT